VSSCCSCCPWFRGIGAQRFEVCAGHIQRDFKIAARLRGMSEASGSTRHIHRYIAAADEKIEAVMVNDGEVSMPVRQSPSTYELASRMPSGPHATLPDADPVAECEDCSTE
jgi:hypothetical protein